MSGYRILLLTPQLPYPPEQGTSLRNFHILRGLAAGHQVSLLSFHEADRPAEPAELGPLSALCEQIVTVPAPRRGGRRRFWQLVATRQPDMAHRLADSVFQQRLGQLLQTLVFDIVQVEGIEMARYIPTVRAASPGSRILFDDHNAEAELQWRAFRTDLGDYSRWPGATYSWIQARRLRRFEAWAYQAADWVTAVSMRDAAQLEELSRRPVVAVPNCIDLADYRPYPGLRPWDYDLVLSGKMDYRPNVDAVLWFGQRIWPLIKQNRPEVSWAIVGQKPHSRLRPVREMPGVTVTGRVEQVQPYLFGAKVYILPFRIGSGTRLKLLEAMATGRAIVSTPLGAEGYPVVHDEHLLLASNPADFALQVTYLLSRPAERRRLGEAARKLAQDYDWRRVVNQFERLYSS